MGWQHCGVLPIFIGQTSNDASDDIMSLLSMPSTREKQSKLVGEEILELLTKHTAKERSLAEKFKSHGGAQVMEFCPYGKKVECLKAQQAAAEMAAKKRREIEQNAVSDKAEDSNAETNSSGTPDESSTTNSEECKKEEPAAALLVAPIDEIITSSHSSMNSNEGQCCQNIFEARIRF
ncbi:uncharacterized protein LOC129921218 [Episyrphus balteatus]|uniref:uncharacterized protein LOC129921218 n=1 Tax=Episyrphus balteatus TaxID=286459 RepID=UPI0024860308|nr:uncharacterized protein LOC129921218 [Episyrphus balteatus]